MSKTMRIILIALLLIFIIASSAACSKEMDTDRFASVLAENGLGATILQTPDEENDYAELTMGIHPSGDLYVFLRNSKDKKASEEYYNKMRGTLADVSASGGVEGTSEETKTMYYTKTVADYSYAENDGTGDGSYTVLILSGKTVITVMTKDVSLDSIALVDKLVKDLGYDE
ncbi:MAG: hypothetical protein JW780_04525 [Clostridiales bacterium]|nr:hypothetical protein [Clostridiales bacterium]